MVLGEEIDVAFRIPMPKSWSKAKKAAMVDTKHQQKPDIDNLLKAIMDAVLPEDSHVWGVRAYKFWAETGSIVIAETGVKQL